MPFKSEKQMRYMFANHPEIAKEWYDKYGPPPKEKKGKYFNKKATLPAAFTFKKMVKATGQKMPKVTLPGKIKPPTKPKLDVKVESPISA